MFKKIHLPAFISLFATTSAQDTSYNSSSNTAFDVTFINYDGPAGHKTWNNLIPVGVPCYGLNDWGNLTSWPMNATTEYFNAYCLNYDLVDFHFLGGSFWDVTFEEQLVGKCSNSSNATTFDCPQATGVTVVEIILECDFFPESNVCDGYWLY